MTFEDFVERKDCAEYKEFDVFGRNGIKLYHAGLWNMNQNIQAIIVMMGGFS